MAVAAGSMLVYQQWMISSIPFHHRAAAACRLHTKLTSCLTNAAALGCCCASPAASSPAQLAAAWAFGCVCRTGQLDSTLAEERRTEMGLKSCGAPVRLAQVCCNPPFLILVLVLCILLHLQQVSLHHAFAPARSCRRAARMARMLCAWLPAQGWPEMVGLRNQASCGHLCRAPRGISVQALVARLLLRRAVVSVAAATAKGASETSSARLPCPAGSALGIRLLQSPAALKPYGARLCPATATHATAQQVPQDLGRSKSHSPGSLSLV